MKISNLIKKIKFVRNKVPSVNVSMDGEVILRSSGGVQILINGKPSILADESANTLGTITADTIESIEVITNLSAKYAAYCDENLSKELQKKNSCLFTSKKDKRNTPKTLKQMDFAFKKQLNTADNLLNQLSIGYTKKQIFKMLPKLGQKKDYDYIFVLN